MHLSERIDKVFALIWCMLGQIFIPRRCDHVLAANAAVDLARESGVAKGSNRVMRGN